MISPKVMRARCEPGQRWMPAPNDRCRLGKRSITNRSASGKASGSRPDAISLSSTRSPAFIGQPRELGVLGDRCGRGCAPAGTRGGTPRSRGPSSVGLGEEAGPVVGVLVRGASSAALVSALVVSTPAADGHEGQRLGHLARRSARRRSRRARSPTRPSSRGVDAAASISSATRRITSTVAPQRRGTRACRAGRRRRRGMRGRTVSQSDSGNPSHSRVTAAGTGKISSLTSSPRPDSMHASMHVRAQWRARGRSRSAGLGREHGRRAPGGRRATPGGRAPRVRAAGGGCR